MNKSNNKGFSLVELIVVIAIMAILVGAIAPQVIKYIDKSKESKDKANLSTVLSAVNTAISDYGTLDGTNINNIACSGTAIDSLTDTTFASILSGILGDLSKVVTSNGGVTVTITSGGQVTVSDGTWTCDQNGCS